LLRLDEILTERVKRLGQLAEKVSASLDQAVNRHGADPDMEPFRGQREFCDRIPRMEAHVRGDAKGAAPEERNRFLHIWAETDASEGYVRAIQSLDDEAREAGTAWLQAVVDMTVSVWQSDRPG